MQESKPENQCELAQTAWQSCIAKDRRWLEAGIKYARLLSKRGYLGDSIGLDYHRKALGVCRELLEKHQDNKKAKIEYCWALYRSDVKKIYDFEKAVSASGYIVSVCDRMERYTPYGTFKEAAVVAKANRASVVKAPNGDGFIVK